MIYKYVCNHCKDNTERNVAIAERNFQYCDKCNRLLERVIEFPQICIPRKFDSRYDDDRAAAMSGKTHDSDAWSPAEG